MLTVNTIHTFALAQLNHENNERKPKFLIENNRTKKKQAKSQIEITRKKIEQHYVEFLLKFQGFNRPECEKLFFLNN